MEFLCYQLYAKLKSVKAVLKVQNLYCFGNLKQRVMEARANLDLAQKMLLILLGGLIVCLRRGSAFMPMCLSQELRNLF